MSEINFLNNIIFALIRSSLQSIVALESWGALEEKNEEIFFPIQL